MKSTPNAIQAWSVAARMRTQPIPAIQVLTGTALAYSLTGTVNWEMFIYTWFVAIFVTMGVNLINDVIDFEKGGDKPKRLGFLKVISAGLIPKEQVWYAGLTCLALVVIFAIPLAVHAGWWIFPLILICAACAYCYTGGPYPISYLGLSELFILLFYGLVCVATTFYIQTGFLSPMAILCAVQMGMLAILPNATNNFRDMHDDEADGKRTLAVRFGRTFARWEITLLTFIPYLLGFAWLYYGYVEAALFPLIVLPVAFIFVRCIWVNDPGPIFNRFFGLSVLVHFFFGVLLICGFLIRNII